MDTFIWPYAEITECWTEFPRVTKQENCMAQSDALIVMHAMFFSQNTLGLDHPMPIVPQSMANMTAQSCSIKWGRLFTINNQHCLSMVSFCSKIMDHLNTILMCKIWCNAGVGWCWHILHTLQISPDVITGCLHVWKNIFGAHNMNWQTMSALLSLPLYIAWARMTRPATDRLSHRWKKCVDSAGDYTEHSICFWHRITH
jgi:hypothetical protein